jgi:hypothetical protein
MRGRLRVPRMPRALKKLTMSTENLARRKTKDDLRDLADAFLCGPDGRSARNISRILRMFLAVHPIRRTSRSLR